MTDFTMLPVTGGVGPYHFNRFRVVFQRPSGMTKEQLATDFVTAFSHYFNNRYASVVFHSDRTLDGNPTLEFHGIVEALGLDIARPHNDWVGRIWCNPTVGLTAQTLKREFLVSGEDFAAAGGGILAGAAIGAGVGVMAGGIGAGPGAAGGAIIGGVGGVDAAVHWNRMHFLAGRRSWRLDAGLAFGIPGDVCVLETIAVERFSSRFFVAGDLIMHLENMIPQIWIANLANFVRLRRLSPVPQSARPGWRGGDLSLNINYYTFNADTVEQLRSSPEYASAHSLYPTILPS